MKKYSTEQRVQILKEIDEVGGNAALVAKKHGIPRSTIATWSSQRKPHNIEKHREKAELKDLKRKLSDAELENKILKELLKKTYQVWNYV